MPGAIICCISLIVRPLYITAPLARIYITFIISIILLIAKQLEINVYVANDA